MVRVNARRVAMTFQTLNEVAQYILWKADEFLLEPKQTLLVFVVHKTYLPNECSRF
jgi:hypothetical protein